MARNNRSQALAQVNVIGTEQHYRQSVDSVEVARISCGQYVEYFRAAGASTGTEVGRAAVRHAAQFGDLSADQASVSPTTLIRKVRSGEITGQTAKAVRWVWSIETRARQVLKAAPAAAAPAPAAAAPAPAAAAPAPAAAAPATHLPTAGTINCDRSALQVIVDQLHRASREGSWSQVQAAIGELESLII